MKNISVQSILHVAAVSLTLASSVHAQEFFRNFGTSRSSGGMGPVYPSEYTYEEGSPSGLRPLRPGQELTLVEQAEEEDKYNFALGPMRFSVAAGAGIEFNDNITLSENNRQSDFIFRPTLDLESRWRISDLNTLRFSVQGSYAKYFDHSEYDTDGILLSPNSELALTFFLSTIKFTVRDRFSYQEDTYDIPQLSNVATYGRWENQAGVEMDWQINQQFDLTAGYDHYNLWSKDHTFDRQDRSVDTLYVRPAMQLTPSLKVGLNLAYSFIDFDSETRADGNNLLVGPYIEYQLSEFTNFYLEAGFQNLSFDGSSSFDVGDIPATLTNSQRRAVDRSLQDSGDSSTWYAKFEIQNKPSENFRHRLSGSKTSEVGFGSNYYDLYHVEYDAEWKLAEKTDVGPSVFYEYYETSGAGEEKAHRVGATFGVRRHISNSVTLGLDYRYLLKDSNLQGADYYQNLAFLSLYYKF